MKSPTNKKIVTKSAARKPARKNAPVGLVDRCFVIWTEGRKVQYQGRVVTELPDGFYLVQFFDFLMGGPSTLAVFHISKFAADPLSARVPGSFEFFENDEHLRDWFDHTYQPS